VRQYRPDTAFSSDFIIGFPGESDEDFAGTVRLVEEIGFSSAYTFKYSPRPGTPAADMADQVPEAVKDARLQAIQALVTKQQRAFQESMVGKTLDVLVERIGRKPGQVAGKSPHLLAVAFEGSADLIGQIVSVEIVESVTNSLIGQLSDRPRAVA
jgi:tRNA-2-methylthio-N6-dimethylallyladenosine synthase